MLYTKQELNKIGIYDLFNLKAKFEEYAELKKDNTKIYNVVLEQLKLINEVIDKKMEY